MVEHSRLPTTPRAPQVPLDHLDQLWFQVAGTRCNLTCHHCFISCNPHNHSFGFLTLEQVRRRLREAEPLGVKEYYFTGGEPFLNPQLVSILIETLAYGPATVLTNATVCRDEWLGQLARAEAESLYTLELRVSIDGWNADSNDPIRGAGTFDRALAGVSRMVEHGFLPIITMARTWPEEDEPAVIERFAARLRAVGYSRPRLKILPLLRLGAEQHRTRGYRDDECVRPEDLEGFDLNQLICHRARIVTDRGVHVCPILIEQPDSLLGQTLHDAVRPFALRHGACYTCYQYGAICSNPGSGTGGMAGA